jgi:hypothetical protein
MTTFNFLFHSITGSILSSRKYYSTGRSLTNAQRSSFSVSPHLHEVIIGSSLGDLYINKQRNNARLMFQQGSVHELYMIHLYDLFKDYCGSGLKYIERKPDLRTGKIYSTIRFNSYSLLCFNYYHSLFYVDGVKIIPLNIEELLTPVGLAYWAMDDGCKLGNGFKFSTNSYTFEEVQLLVNVLKNNFDLDCSIHNFGKDQFTIFIKQNSMDKFRSLVTPYFHTSMLYKLD